MISSMKEGMAEMKKMIQGLVASPTRPQHLPDTAAGVLPSPPTETTPIPLAMQALVNFTQNATPEGPIPSTAQRMLAEQNAGGNVAAPPPVTMPAVPPAPTAMGHAPLLGLNRSSQQAGRILQALQERKAGHTINPNWGTHFWQDVAFLDSAEALE